MSNEEKKNEHAEVVAGQEVPEADHEQAALKAVEIAQKEILYIRAEFDNYKKRILKEQEQAIRFANKNLIAELLNVVDFFDRALSHAEKLKTRNDGELSNFVSGVEMTRHELVQLLGRFGVEFVGEVGEKFDPEKHEAISQQVVHDKDADTVIEVLQKGCLLQGKLLKPARVVVSQQ